MVQKRKGNLSKVMLFDFLKNLVNNLSGQKIIHTAMRYHD
jgi:hypothetical protein